MASKTKNSISTGVKKGHFGVTDMKIDSQVLSLKKMEKSNWRQFNADWCHKKETGVKNSRIGVMEK